MFDLLWRHAGPDARWIVVTTALGGLLAALVVTAVLSASAEGDQPGGATRAILFLAALGGMYALRRRASAQIIAVFERSAADLRARFAASVRRAPLRSVEALGARLDRTSADLSYLSTTLEYWVSGIQQLAFVLSITLAISFISARALALWCLTLGLVALWLRHRLTALRRELEHLGPRGAEMAEQVGQLVDGFQQVKLDARVGDALGDDIERAVDTLYDHQLEVEDISTRVFITAFTAIFLIGWGLAGFGTIPPFRFDPVEAYELVIYFEQSMTPVFGILMALPEVARAEAAAIRILEVIDALPSEPEPEPHRRPSPPAPFQTLALRNAEYAYGDDGRGFVVGPIDLRIARGELVFVTGGNGSGKTTLMKMLTGLYPLSRGQHCVDDRQATAAQREAWRDQFTVIVSHQHLFDRLYGLEHAPQPAVDALLARLGIDDVVSYRDGRFSDLSLSTGQRMRLAMVVALLEDRPVCVFDEWTANQDPETTHWYYETLLPELRAAGKTVVAVSHDDRFFDRADHIIRMRDGRLVG